MRRTFKYKKNVKKWNHIDIGDVLILKEKDGTLFDAGIVKKVNMSYRCRKCSLSKDGQPDACL